jgi:uncharacterized protein YecE (DUF72 family)
MGKVFCGVSGWAYAEWKPEFYPVKLSSAKFLGYYSSRLNSVEVNYTFRGFPTVRSLAQQGEVFAYYKHFDFPECPLQAEELLNATKSA